LAAAHDCVLEVRGKGLLLGLALDRPGKDAVKYCLGRGMIVNCTAERVLRFVPPLVVSREEIGRLVPVLDAALSELEK
jgi:acetylornithine/succinyldiaminopimelate/putrescine aminotransferase